MFLAAVFGAATAAFLPRAAGRLAVGFADRPRRTCAFCARPFAPGVAGWIHAGPACSCSGGYVGTVLAGAAVATVLAVAVGTSALLPVYLVAAVPGLLLALVDLRCLRLPDPLVGALAIGAGVPLALIRPERVSVAVAAAGTVLTAYLVVALMPRGGLGLGDAKLAAVLALILGFAGWPAVLTGMLAAHLINGSIALALLITGRADRRRPLAFGPALLTGALVAIATA